ncbi:MAG: hypothetical protein DRN17_03425 [Thermoplasmata archaeon]|mgnify:CR=1 FL=1|nr:MAG: hypothetical protein DRN17_03425 [Thermoplasmata archaeon]
MKIEIGRCFADIEYENYAIMFVVPCFSSDLFNKLDLGNNTIIWWMEWFRDDDGWNTPWISI